MVVILQPGQKLENNTQSDSLVFLEISQFKAKELYYQLMDLKNNLSGQLTLIEQAPEVYELLSALHQTYAAPTINNQTLSVSKQRHTASPPHTTL